MITHYIIMSSSYSKGKRIAVDFPIDKGSQYEKLKYLIENIIQECGRDVSISTHFIQTDSELWSSVVEKDHFFKDVQLIENIEEFIKLIKKDRVLLGTDVAKYILSKVKCTHLKLQKLVYLCYAEYLCQYDKKLFTDEIYAYKYGPVVKSVYEKYKGQKEIDNEETIISNVGEMPSRSRILFAEDGINKTQVIDDIIKKYGDFSAGDLVDMTHNKLTPWDVCGRGEYVNKIIDNETIKKYHQNEVI